MREPTDDELAARVRNHHLYKEIEARKSSVITVREHNASELEALVRNHPLYSTLNADVTRLRTRTEELLGQAKVLKRHSVLVALDELGMITWPVDKNGQAVKDVSNPLADFFVFTPSICGPCTMFGVIPRRPGDELRMRLKTSFYGEVEFSISYVEEDSLSAIRFKTTVMGGKYVPDVRFEDPTVFEKGMMRREGYCHSPTRDEYQGWAEFKMNFMLNKAGSRANPVEVVVVAFATFQEWRKAMSAQTAKSLVEASPDVNRGQLGAGPQQPGR